MEKNYRTLVALFTAITIISLAGFFNSYFRYFPKFENIPAFTHVHFIIFLSWFAILIWQPYLIKQRKLSLHRKLGRFTYFLAPVMVLSILMMVKLSVAKNLAISPQSAAMALAGSTLDVIFFSAFYILSMIYKRNIRQHVAFLIGASLIILNPGLGRLIIHLFSQQAGILAMSLTPYLVFFTILIYEKVKLKRPVFKSPYLLIPVLWTCELALFILLPNTSFWQKFVAGIAKI